MTFVQLALVGVAVALIVSPTLRIVGRWMLSWAVASVEAEIKKAVPSLAEQVENLIPDIAPPSTADMHTVLDLAARLQAQGKAEAVKLCQQLIDQLLQQPKV
jgi:hypothetical protein